MSQKKWIVEAGGERHTVDLHWNTLILGGRVLVDGWLLSGWGWTLRSKDIEFELAGKRVKLRFTVNHLATNKQELYVDGGMLEPVK